MNKCLYEFRIIILIENENLNTANMGWKKHEKAKNTNGKG